MAKLSVKIILGFIALVACAFMVSSPLPAGAESLEEVIPVYTPVALEAGAVTPVPLGEKTPYAPNQEAYLADQAGYLDDSISVRVEEFRWFDTNIQVTWVQIADASQLRTAFAGKYPSKKTQYGDQLAKREKAVLAINGDYIVHMNTGFAARNGVILRERQGDKDARMFDTLMIDEKGDFTIVQSIHKENIAAYLENHTVMHAFTFGPGLVVDGVKQTEFPVKNMVPTHSTQRQGIGQMDELSYVIVTTEGPDDKNSEGLTLYQMADIFEALGAKNAYNLDGGSSSWLVLNNKRINGLHGSKHRDIADIIYFVTAVPEGGK